MRYPFRYYIENYLKRQDGHFAEYTINVRRRRLYQFGKIFTILNNEKAISTENPLKLTPDDIDIFIGYRKKMNVSSETILSDISILNKYLLFLGNDCVVRFKAINSSHVPIKNHKRLPPLNSAMYDRIIKNANDLDENNWTMMSAYAIVIFSVCGGLRSKEVRMANVDNLTVDDLGAKLFLVHVKGEGTWGQPRVVPICLDGVPFVKKYLVSRETKLKSVNIASNALIPSVQHAGYLSANSMLKLKYLVEKDVGFQFELRTCRRTYGQNLIDIGVDITDVQLALGHTSPTTTFKVYCGKRPERAVNDIQQFWLSKQEKELKK
jgi:integrase/recombinase XerD